MSTVPATSLDKSLSLPTPSSATVSVAASSSSSVGVSPSPAPVTGGSGGGGGGGGKSKTLADRAVVDLTSAAAAAASSSRPSASASSAVSLGDENGGGGGVHGHDSDKDDAPAKVVKLTTTTDSTSRELSVSAAVAAAPAPVSGANLSSSKTDAPLTLAGSSTSKSSTSTQVAKAPAQPAVQQNEHVFLKDTYTAKANDLYWNKLLFDVLYVAEIVVFIAATAFATFAAAMTAPYLIPVVVALVSISLTPAFDLLKILGNESSRIGKEQERNQTIANLIADLTPAEPKVGSAAEKQKVLQANAEKLEGYLLDILSGGVYGAKKDLEKAEKALENFEKATSNADTQEAGKVKETNSQKTDANQAKPKEKTETRDSLRKKVSTCEARLQFLAKGQAGVSQALEAARERLKGLQQHFSSGQPAATVPFLAPSDAWLAKLIPLIARYQYFEKPIRDLDSVISALESKGASEEDCIKELMEELKKRADSVVMGRMEIAFIRFLLLSYTGENRAPTPPGLNNFTLFDDRFARQNPFVLPDVNSGRRYGQETAIEFDVKPKWVVGSRQKEVLTFDELGLDTSAGVLSTAQIGECIADYFDRFNTKRAAEEAAKAKKQAEAASKKQPASSSSSSSSSAAAAAAPNGKKEPAVAAASSSSSSSSSAAAATAPVGKKESPVAAAAASSPSSSSSSAAAATAQEPTAGKSSSKGSSGMVMTVSDDKKPTQARSSSSGSSSTATTTAQEPTAGSSSSSSSASTSAAAASSSSSSSSSAAPVAKAS